MNYDNFVQKCKEHNYTPSGLVKELGISDGNLGSWKKGGNPSLSVLNQLANKLKCSTDYLLGVEDTSVTPKDILDKTFKTFMALPQRIASLKSGKVIEEPEQLEKYLNCEQGFLFMTEITEYCPADKNYTAEQNVKMEYKILDILDRLADTANYKALQIQISRIMLFWLKRSDEEKYGKLCECASLAQGKLKFIQDGTLSKSKNDNYGFNTSDVFFLMKHFNVSVGYMFTGNENSR
ncbi:MAG: helix-turn-helix domain-containing protein [Lachnospiraceae bacterium]|nr:helix-turn-helix domain-containing protein [Lachnospiraceae bacterium]